VKIVEFIFPKTCPICHRIGKDICAKCESAFEPAKLKCSVCSKHNPAGLTCEDCLKKYSPDQLLALYRYDGALKELIHKFKFEDITAAAEYFADELSKKIDWKRYEDFTIVPVPISFWRKFYRGYNQCEIIAKSLSRKIGLPVEKLLACTSRIPQSQIEDYNLRKENIKGKFFLLGKKVPENVIVLDDIYTSGATLKEICRVLKRGGAKKVIGVVIALAQ